MDGGNSIWTIGHSTHPLVELVDMLKKNEINLLVDVRSFPGSRRSPQFNKENLELSIPAVGIEYTHILDLGGRRRTNKNSPNTTWRHPAFRGYADYMETDPFALGVARLESLARTCNACFMCSEAWWVKCHRRMLADALASRAWDVFHIAGTSVKRHELASPARIVDGVLTYHPVHQPQTMFDFSEA